MPTPRVLTGLDVLARSRPAWLRRGRVGLLMHQASVSSRLESARDVLARLCGDRLTALFGPQHGISGEKQDNMIESAHGTDARLGIPIFSLYSETRSPTPEMLSHIDTLVVDLQDVGTRVYTFEWTTALALEACAAAGVPVVVLDRPNPLGGVQMEGNVIRPGYESFVGLYPVPMRHGLTLGEIARLVNARLGARDGAGPCDLTVVPMKGWRRRMSFADTGLPWILPSPNMPTLDTTMVYPGQVLLEGTNISEGRGTTRPFEVWGAPWLETDAFRNRFAKRRLPGVTLRDHDFQPTFHKWHGEVCRGFQIHVTDRARFRPYVTTLAILQDVIALHRDVFEWKWPPYEYVTDRLPVDVLTGDPAVRQAVESSTDLGRLAASWRREMTAFQREAAPWLLYR
ncbi:MAG: exo-beta-N-acetylmuramidase NamZ family protein [Candidatus Polarisedimenticolia bacterium]